MILETERERQTDNEMEIGETEKLRCEREKLRWEEDREKEREGGGSRQTEKEMEIGETGRNSDEREKLRWEREREKERERLIGTNFTRRQARRLKGLTVAGLCTTH